MTTKSPPTKSRPSKQLLRRLRRYVPSAQQQWREERREALADALASGMTMPELAEVFEGVSKQWIFKALALPAKKATRRSTKG